MSAPEMQTPALGAGAAGAQTETDGGILTAADSRRKAFEQLRAELALAGGFALLELSDGTYLISRWSHCRPCADLAAVRQFLRQIGGRP